MHNKKKIYYIQSYSLNKNYNWGDQAKWLQQDNAYKESNGKKLKIVCEMTWDWDPSWANTEKRKGRTDKKGRTGMGKGSTIYLNQGFTCFCNLYRYINASKCPITFLELMNKVFNLCLP